MNAYIVAGYRSAVGKAPKGVFRFTRPDDLAADVIKHLMAQVPNLDPARVDDLTRNANGPLYFAFVVGQERSGRNGQSLLWLGR